MALLNLEKFILIATTWNPGSAPSGDRSGDYRAERLRPPFLLPIVLQCRKRDAKS
jgi:hypothetical protein